MPNTGGGGGAQGRDYNPTTGGAGGSGVVIVRYIDINPASVAVQFTTVGTTNWIAPTGVTSVEALVVGGGGGGGVDDGGGGGAGGLIYTSAFPVTPGTSYTVTVGAGGVGARSAQAATNGGNSVFSTLTAIGGGYGLSLIHI